ncbi:hypothetical protein CJ739_2222 [Mariniflexile rhizosphaerae]|uniref:T9SS type A sorting domain-containing protein n=1 Tax=unclassified Mariniflexile TaxID=2643887 RepID=UPI000CB3AE7D|nr:T9SS type A sorting domain-containing protein [Mariniflexile sp. TRM1-10]AXP81302.1 hypothetical protein CJ739_2222 [Mariniflexile sp. TRM1-10]PLB17876.1 MAG: Secreted protein with Por secretion system C-terminal sorting domain [Flavobacteriaceae bacterium FS1-H7996/R]
MKYNYPLFICFFTVFLSKAQTVVTSDKFNLPETVEETSGLIYYDNKLITHNDSGNAAELYEIDTSNGSIVRTVSITNATNVDWEDIAQDNTYIYIGDIGNNYGNRTNLKFYRILKTDFDSSTNVTADVINYSYADQTDFTSNLNNNNWDSEAFVVYDNYLLIFSKNWANNEVDVYTIPNTVGTHSAVKVSTYNSQGLITGADVVGSNKIYLSGYSVSSNITPFLIEIYNLDISAPLNLDVFTNSKSVKLNNFLPFGNQVEGICFIETNGFSDTLYISNEKLVASIFTFPSKLRALTIDNSTLRAFNFIKNDGFIIHPNPFENEIKFSDNAEEIKIYNSLGSCVLSQNATNSINTSELSPGFYTISVTYKKMLVTKKMIK